jgi:phage terminase small subunit
MPHPAAALLRQSRALMLSLAKEFGMTAASYARLPKHEEPAKDANPLTQFGITS